MKVCPVCCIHQPEHLPYAGFFAKLLRCNTWIVYDTAQYQKGHFHNRNRIATYAGKWQWLTVPVSYAHHQAPINEVHIAHEYNPQKYLAAIRRCYENAPMLDMLLPPIQDAAYRAAKHRLLLDFNLDLSGVLMQYLGAQAVILLASSLPDACMHGGTSEKLVSMCSAINANTYVCGEGSTAYLDFDAFAPSGIAVKLLQYTPPTPAALPHFSALHLCMHYPPSQAKQMILSAAKTVTPQMLTHG